MNNCPDSRAEVIARGKALAADPNYPTSRSSTASPDFSWPTRSPRSPPIDSTQLLPKSHHDCRQPLRPGLPHHQRRNASPAKLVLMLFDGAVRFLNQALAGFDLDAAAARNEMITGNIVKSQRIISELRCSLNLEKGGELAQTLHRLYSFMDDQLRQANTKKDRAPSSPPRNCWANCAPVGPR